MKKILSITFLLAISFSYAQETPDLKFLLNNAGNQTQVDSIQLLYPNISIRTITLVTGDENLNEKITSATKGQIIHGQNGKFMKLIAKKTVKEFKVKYIFLDGNSMKTEKIKTLQSKILNDYSEGVSFGELANTHSMDPRKNEGDLGWFPEGRMVKNFEESIKNHKKDEIFTAFEPSNNWYFVVLKTHDERESGEYEYVEITNLKINYANDITKKERILNPTISIFVDEFGKITRYETHTINCFNCIPEDINDTVLKSIIGKCFKDITAMAIEKKYKRGNGYSVPFTILLE